MKKMKLKELLELWLERYMKHTIKIRTYNRYKSICELHLIKDLGEYELDELKPNVLQDFLLKKIDDHYSTNTIKGIVSVLKQALRLAITLEFVDKEYCSNLKMPSSEEKEISVFTKKEQQVIESFCLNHKKRNYIGIVICLYTGIRLGELLALTWDDIDFNSNLLTINKTSYSAKVDGKTQIIVDKPKTKKSNRVIPLPNQLVKLLKIIKKESNSKYVITTRNSGIVGNRSYQRTFKFILKKVNVPYRNFHSLRHTFATNAIELGMDVKTLAEILGHTNAMITLNRYSHSLLNYKIEMMNKLGKNLNLSIKNA
ncbi:MAG TPA: hypothetical protein DHG20_06490 [Acholeplasmatales bacterium]|jgi:integrase|nr:hypothetical protein [Acholeplasmatales bacterium]